MKEVNRVNNTSTAAASKPKSKRAKFEVSTCICMT